MVVDDDPAIREMLLLALGSAGFDTQQATSAAEARRGIDAASPDLILLDWMLPGQSGYEFARALYMDTSRPAIPVIMLTARDQVEDKVAALMITFPSRSLSANSWRVSTPCCAAAPGRRRMRSTASETCSSIRPATESA
jgi:CheY-like chemotaxis protein